MYLLLVLLISALCMYIFFQVYAPFGGKTKASAKKQSANFVNGKFVNQIATPMNMSFADVVLLVRKQLQRDTRRKPPQPLTPLHSNLSKPIKPESAQITWFGHSSFLLQVSGKNILLDPMFSKSPSPFKSIGPKRFSDSLPVQPEDLPPIDLVVISHDHYDHLDYASIKKLASKTKMFFVPLGLAAHLQKWGVSEEQITELDWWEERVYEGITLSCTPSRHFSGRTLTDRFATLWCSWVILTPKTKLFFSGDSGYGPHFKQIGNKYGPFDITLLECGQYDPLWSTIHMTPEQTAQAHIDLRGKRMIPMHWGAFALSFHSWTDPVERVLAAGKKANATIITPQFGEVVDLANQNYTSTAWWKTFG